MIFKMQKPKSNLFLKLKLNGFTQINSCKVDPFQISKLYESYNVLLVNSLNEEYQKSFSNFDHALFNFLKKEDLKLNTQSISMEKISSGGAVSHISSFQYLHDFKAHLNKEKIRLNPECEDFLNQMDNITNHLVKKIGEVFDLPESIFLLKISKYIKNQRDENLMPFHYDSTLLTVIVDTKDSVSGRLAVIPGGILAENKEPHLISENALPIIFTGHEGFKTFGIPPVSHGVINFNQNEENPERYSLILFILAKSALN